MLRVVQLSILLTHFRMRSNSRVPDADPRQYLPKSSMTIFPGYLGKVYALRMTRLLAIRSHFLVQKAKFYSASQAQAATSWLWRPLGEVIFSTHASITINHSLERRSSYFSFW